MKVALIIACAGVAVTATVAVTQLAWALHVLSDLDDSYLDDERDQW